MSETQGTVRQAVDFDASLRPKLADAVREKLGALKGLGGSVLEAAVDRVVDHAGELLDTPLAELLSAAWGRYPAIKELCDARRNPHDRDTMAELANHRFDWRHEPQIEIAFNQLPPFTIPLVLSVGITMAGGVLVVRGGRLAELRAGKGNVGVKVAVADREVAERTAARPRPRVLTFPVASAAREAVPVGRIAAPGDAPSAAAEAAARAAAAGS
jgi:hypothetical protein